MRKLASLQKITNIRPIDGADKIELADVLGWQVVVRKGEFKVGDLVVYFEVDSWLDSSNPAFASFEDRFTNWGEKRGMRLKTIKLRKQLSQGLILPIASLPVVSYMLQDSPDVNAEVGLDLTETLGIEKWEPLFERAENAGISGATAARTRPFPLFLRKTDQERVQNIGGMLSGMLDHSWEVTTKLDGSSMTVYFVGKSTDAYDDILSERKKAELKKKDFFGRLFIRAKRALGLEKDPEFLFGVCSRNVELDINADNHFSTYVRECLQEKIIKCLYSTDAIAIQGELIAPTIQENYEKVEGPEFYVFDMFDIDAQEYVLPQATRSLAAELGLDHVPVVEESLTLRSLYDGNDAKALTDAVLAYAEGPGMNVGVKREGVVFKNLAVPNVSFKAISNSYLLKKG